MQYPPNDSNDPWSLSTPDLPTQPYQAIPPRAPKPASWWNRQRKGVQVVIGCGSLIVALAFCGLCAAVGNAAAHNNQASTTTPIATSASGNVAVVASTTDSPTVSVVSPTVTTATGASQNSGTPTHPAASTPTATPVRPTPTANPTGGPTAAPASPTPGRTPTPPRPTPTPTPSCQAINNNPWCYNFTPGSLITSPPATFCNYFRCIPSFWNGHGFVNECVDGSYSLSGGISGDCSSHGGEQQPLYSH